MSDHIPKAGEALTIKDVEVILEAVGARKKNFPDEPAAMTIALVLMNIGDRYAKVSCVAGEWVGLKTDIPKSETNDIPKCPNGHVLTQDRGLSVGWVDPAWSQKLHGV